MNKNIIVTGGAQGIGKIISLELIKSGYSVTVFEIDVEAIEEMKAENNSDKLAFFPVDVASENDVKKALKASNQHFGNIYGLVNNAATHANKPISELTLKEWNRVIAVNVTGPFLCAKYAAPLLKESGGCIVNLCSTRAFQSEPNTEAYSASKGGIFALTHALAMSLGPEVRVNCISPGWIDVSGIRKKSMSDQYVFSVDDHLQHPAGRVGKATDISNMVLFLLRPENSFITGQNIFIDGGMTRKMIYV